MRCKRTTPYDHGKRWSEETSCAASAPLRMTTVKGGQKILLANPRKRRNDAAHKVQLRCELQGGRFSGSNSWAKMCYRAEIAGTQRSLAFFPFGQFRLVLCALL